MEVPESLRPSSASFYAQKTMERMSSNYSRINRAETINEILTARRLVLARLTVESTMGHGESQIGYLANDITLHDGMPLRLCRHIVVE